FGSQPTCLVLLAFATHLARCKAPMVQPTEPLATVLVRQTELAQLGGSQPCPPAKKSPPKLRKHSKNQAREKHRRASPPALSLRPRKKPPGRKEPRPQRKNPPRGKRSRDRRRRPRSCEPNWRQCRSRQPSKKGSSGEQYGAQRSPRIARAPTEAAPERSTYCSASPSTGCRPYATACGAALQGSASRCAWDGSTVTSRRSLGGTTRMVSTTGVSWAIC